MKNVSTNTILAKELKKNIQIMTNTFESNNLQVLNIGCKPYSDNDSDFDLYVELAAISGSDLKYSCKAKINLYDEDNELYMTKEEDIYKDDFSGYDTITISCYDNRKTLKIATKGRLYLTKS